jgi:putative endopeptidase
MIVMTKASLNSYDTDQTVRPQDDFYGYANNSWLRAHPIPESESRWGTFMQLRDEAWQNLRHIYEELQDEEFALGSDRQQVRDFYYTGMHFDVLKEAHRQVVDGLFDQVDKASSSSELSAVIGALHAKGIEGPWAYFVDADNLDSSRHAIRFHQAGLTLPDRDYYLEDSDKIRLIRSKFDEHISRVFEHFPRLGDQSVIFDFEHGLAEISRSSTALRDVEANYHRATFDQLAKEYPAIDWQAYAKATGWKQNGIISVDQPEFFAYINQQMADRPLDQWKTYLKWRIIMACYGKMSDQMSELKFEFFGKVLAGTTQQMPLWKRVVLATDDAIGQAAGQLYAQRHFPESSKQQVLDLVEKMRTTYAARIKRLDWMSDETKQYALKKLANIKVLIGYPDEWRDFSSLTISRASYLGNALAAEEFDNAFWLARLDQPTSREDWFMDPQTVNAYHDPNRLVICFPAAILQKPFFEPNAPLAANMGGIGTVIGHEFTHGFDDQGCMFDAEGNVRTWQSEAERKAFAKRAQVIIDQADHFEILPGLHLKGGLIIGESIADLGGLEIAFEALTEELGEKLQEAVNGDLSAAQLFYINYARTECTNVREEKLREYTLTDPHPASQFRVNGMVQHDDDFYGAFNVESNDALYLVPDQRANIW